MENKKEKPKEEEIKKGLGHITYPDKPTQSERTESDNDSDNLTSKPEKKK